MKKFISLLLTALCALVCASSSAAQSPTINKLGLYIGGASLGDLTTAPYSWELEPLYGQEKLYVIATFSDGTRKRYCALNGTELSEVNSGGFSLSSNIRSCTLTVNIEDGIPVSYTLSNVSCDEIVLYGLVPSENDHGIIPFVKKDDRYVLETDSYLWDTEFVNSSWYLVTVTADKTYTYYGINSTPEANTTYDISTDYPPFTINQLGRFVAESKFDPETGEPIDIIFKQDKFPQVRLVNYDGSQIYEFETTGTGITWKSTGTVNPFLPENEVGALDSDEKRQAAYHLEIVRNGKISKYYFSDNDYGVNVSVRCADNWIEGGETDYFRFRNAVSDKLYDFTVVLYEDMDRIRSFIIEENMPESEHPLIKLRIEQEKRYGSWAFDPKLTITLDDKTLEEKVREGDDSPTIREMMKSLIIVPDQKTAERIQVRTNMIYWHSADESLRSWSVKSNVAEENSVLLSDGSTLPAGSVYYRFDFFYKPEPSLVMVWYNVPPTIDEDGSLLKHWEKGKLVDLDRNSVYGSPYHFDVYLVSDDSDIDNWAQLKIEKATAEIDIVSPKAKLEIDKISLTKVDENLIHDPRTTETHKDHLSGTRLHRFGSAAGADNEYETVNPIVYNRLNEITATGRIPELNLWDEHNLNSGYSNTLRYRHQIFIVPSGTDINDVINDADLYAEVTNYTGISLDYSVLYAANPWEKQEFTIKGVKMDESLRTTATDGSHSQVFDAVKEMSFDSYIISSYKVFDPGMYAYQDEVVNVGIGDKNILFTHDIETPDVTVNQVTFSKYISEYYHGSADEDPFHEAGNCGYDHSGPATETLGYFAHGVIDLNIKGIDTEDKAGYVSFHVPQTIYNDTERGGGCYPETDNWWKHSFAGTRAANGGHIAGEWVRDFAVDSNIEPLAYDGVTYTEYSPTGNGEWTLSNDWSTLAVNAGHLPIHVNPIYQYKSLGAYKAIKTLSGEINAKVSAVYPTITRKGVSISSPESEPYTSNPVTGLNLIAATTDVPVSLRGAKIQTGVNPVMGDLEEDALAEYYNLQGIRVANPAKGQVYIVRQGSVARKVLIK